MAILNKYVRIPATPVEHSPLLSTAPFNVANRNNSFTKRITSRAIGSREKFGHFDCKLVSRRSTSRIRIVATALTDQFTPDKSSDSLASSFTFTYPLKRTVKVDGKIAAKVDSVKVDGKSRLILECDIPGSWVLHWGVTYSDDPNRFEELRIPRAKKMQEFASYFTTIPEFQPEWSQHLRAEDRLKVNAEYRKWILAYPNKQQGDPDSIYFQ